MKIVLDNDFKEFLQIVYNCAKNSCLRLFIVGGAVRDYYLNYPVKDFDLILEGNAIEFSDNLPSDIKIKSVHKDFGTVKLIFKNKVFDLASTRSESYPYSGCLPVVDKLGVNIENDVKRRDFTINSMYFEILDNLEFNLIDLVNGLSDIKEKKLKVLHNNSYIDDPTRIFRGLAFKYRFGFDFTNNDNQLIENYLNNIDYSNMSTDRLFSVFKISLNYPFGYDLFKEIILNKYYKILTKDTLTFDFAIIDEIIEKFNFDYLKLPDFFEKLIKSPEILILSDNSFLNTFKTLSKLSDIDLAYNFYKTKNPDILKFLKLKNTKLNITGSDLIDLGCKEGRLIGQILDYILDFKLSNPETLLNKEDEINFAKTKFPLN